MKQDLGSMQIPADVMAIGFFFMVQGLIGRVVAIGTGVTGDGPVTSASS
jgi:hypothetical protein